MILFFKKNLCLSGACGRPNRKYSIWSTREESKLLREYNGIKQQRSSKGKSLVNNKNIYIFFTFLFLDVVELLNILCEFIVQIMCCQILVLEGHYPACFWCFWHTVFHEWINRLRSFKLHYILFWMNITFFLLQIGYWNEADKLVLTNNGDSNGSSSSMENRTYIVTTILVMGNWMKCFICSFSHHLCPYKRKG